ncbi:MAG: hypothetical protein CMF99_00780 [Candidatus Marinimicrobia bacterium]|nr:hypothetical protein [Candidatus Neomarinimicrobiota bacterium]
MTIDLKKEQLKEKSNVKVSQSRGLSKLNYLIFTFGLISIFFGYIIMATGEVNSFQSLTLAPIFLFLGYIILIPISLIIEK